MALCQTSVLKVYHAVIEDVISNVRDAFLDEGVDEQVLQEMKQIWRNKLLASKAVELNPEPGEPGHHPPPIVANNPKVSKAANAKAKKAAAAAAASQQNSNNNGAGASGGMNTSGDSNKPATPAAAAGKSPALTAVGGGGIIKNGGIGAIKQEVTSQNPPPLHPTSGAASMLQKQQQAAAAGGGGNAASGGQTPIPIVSQLDPNRIMPVNITLPSPPGSTSSESRVLTIQVPASALQENQLTQILTAHLISSIMSLPTTLASSVLQQHVNAALTNANHQKNIAIAKQLDGALDSSEEDESEESDDNMDNDDDDDLDKDDDDDAEHEDAAEEEPLNSEDDVTDEDNAEVFDTDNVIVCQYDKITRSRNKWKFYLKDGIMNMRGKDYVFQKSNGDAEW
ncbi:transcription initiation factor IIA subunit 1 isoform X1 [Drosophila sulfurigaster albostrigata]|uniref:Transcription initiation factor IIA subunit 1 isoform X1 n=1 Tax=Drosophila albomicans TaxID=7291 RepID=A0A6P8Y1P4_DROAB|nr:transcription initiation factor IIA subunit 1 isoform X1 [Drosophila albomicans]XP_062125469.1 transcription initiation factor IIA subunit 1 isoform X1 [Drosophila sulfurigaster albostrigata]